MRRVLALTLPCLLLAAAPAAAAETDVKVSELRFRGPAGGNDEFVELVNTGPVRQSIAGFRLVGCSASGPTGTRATVPAARSIPPGGRYLFANSGSSGLGADQSYGTGISDTGGVQVVGAGGTVLDQAGAAASACKEGAGLAIPTANGDNAFERRAGGAQDTNDNAADFEGPKASGATACGAACVDAAAPPPSGEAASVHAIQGAGHRSPLLGRAVTTSGVVIARRANGFYLQEPRPDADPATSEGIFVFTGGEPPAVAAVGAAVQVAGTVAEFRPGGSATANLSITQITRATVTGTGTGSVAPTVIGAGGRVAPTMVIEDDVNGDVERAGTFDPAQDGLDFYESLEGMLVRVNDAVAVGPTSPFGEIPVLADGGAGAGLRSQRGGIVVRPGDFNPERLFLDDAIAADEPAVDVRDRLAGPVDAVVDYSFGNFKLLATAWPGVTDGGLEREVTAAPAADQLAVASFNVENLDPGDPAEKFDRLARTVVENLRSPDVLTVEEVQDDNGARNDAVVDASATWEKLIAAIASAGGPRYEFRDVDPVDDQDGGQPGGNIRVGFLFREDRGLAFVDRDPGGPTTATGVRRVRGDVGLTSSPGRVDPTNPAWEDSRKPLAGEFRWRGKTVIVIANHFASKGGDQPLFGRFQPPERSSEVQRHAQAAVLNRFVDQVQAAKNSARIVVAGDFNDFEFSRTLEILEGGKELVNLMETLPEDDRYSYVFEGNSQALDHILVNRQLRGGAEYDSVHSNAEFADQVSDHDPQVARLRFGG